MIAWSIKDLSDPEYQPREWTKGPQERFSPEMPYINTALLGKDFDHPDVCIPKIDIFFYDEEEASLVHDLCYFLDEIDDDIGYVDIEYMNHPKWPQLMNKAAVVYTLLKANNEKYNFIELHSSNWEQNYKDKYRECQEEFRLERSQDW